MPHRFYAPAFDAGDALVPLPDEEAQHLTRVLRLRPGARVHVFNGRGHECEAEVEALDRRRAVLRVLSAVASAPEVPFPLVLAPVVLKGDKTDDVVRDAVMLGVTALQPIVSARSEVPLAYLERGRRVDRWQRVAVASAKQCGRSVVPPIHEPVHFETALGASMDALQILLVEPSVGLVVRATHDLPQPAAGGAYIFVGPEGGWSDGELEQASASGATLIQFGRRTLRADAAATALLPVLLHVWNAL